MTVLTLLKSGKLLLDGGRRSHEETNESKQETEKDWRERETGKDWKERERLLSLIELSFHVFSFLNRKRSSSFYNFLLIQSSIFIPFFEITFSPSSPHIPVSFLSLFHHLLSYSLYFVKTRSFALRETFFSICEIKTRTIYSACHAIHPWSSSRIVLVEWWWKESECKKEDEQERKERKCIHLKAESLVVTLWGPLFSLPGKETFLLIIFHPSPHRPFPFFFFTLHFEPKSFTELFFLSLYLTAH